MVPGSLASILVQTDFRKLSCHLKIDQRLCVFVLFVCFCCSFDTKMKMLYVCVCGGGDKNPGTNWSEAKLQKVKKKKNARSALTPAEQSYCLAMAAPCSPLETEMQGWSPVAFNEYEQGFPMSRNLISMLTKRSGTKNTLFHVRVDPGVICQI